MSIQGNAALLAIALLLRPGFAADAFAQQREVSRDRALRERPMEIPAGAVVGEVRSVKLRAQGMSTSTTIAAGFLAVAGAVLWIFLVAGGGQRARAGGPAWPALNSPGAANSRKYCRRHAECSRPTR
jgi:hypothetical protein